MVSKPDCKRTKETAHHSRIKMHVKLCLLSTSLSVKPSAEQSKIEGVRRKTCESRFVKPRAIFQLAARSHQDASVWCDRAAGGDSDQLIRRS